MTQIISVNVHTSAKTNKIEAVSADHIKVRLTLAAEKGQANQQLIKLLANHLKISKNRIEIIKGSKSRHKLVKITDL